MLLWLILPSTITIVPIAPPLSPYPINHILRKRIPKPPTLTHHQRLNLSLHPDLIGIPRHRHLNLTHHQRYLIAITGDFHPDPRGIPSEDITVAHELYNAVAIGDVDLVIVALDDDVLALVVVVGYGYEGVV